MNETLLIILVVIAVTAFFASIIGVYAYKKAHHIPTGECAYCHKGTKKTLKEYHKMYCKKC